MRLIATTALLAALAGCSPSHEEHDMKTAHAHSTPNAPHAGHGGNAAAASAELVVLPGPGRPRAGRETGLDFMIHAADGRMVSSFEKTHDREVHLFLVRDDLEHFAHLHPSVDASGNLRVAHVFPAGGSYRLYAEFKPRGGASTVARARLDVTGETGPSRPLTPDVPGRIEAGPLRADVSLDPPAADGGTRISFDLADPTGAPVADLEPWMGELGHLVLMTADGGQLVHTHFDHAASRPGRAVFSAHVGQPGLYKGWAQFQRSGKVQIVEFAAMLGP